jgi:hypothetical protein
VRPVRLPGRTGRGYGPQPLKDALDDSAGSSGQPEPRLLGPGLANGSPGRRPLTAARCRGILPRHPAATHVPGSSRSPCDGVWAPSCAGAALHGCRRRPACDLERYVRPYDKGSRVVRGLKSGKHLYSRRASAAVCAGTEQPAPGNSASAVHRVPPSALGTSGWSRRCMTGLQERLEQCGSLCLPAFSLWRHLHRFKGLRSVKRTPRSPPLNRRSFWRWAGVSRQHTVICRCLQVHTERG